LGVEGSGLCGEEWEVGGWYGAGRVGVRDGAARVGVDVAAEEGCREV
jgi:hypothetical protein